MTAPTASPTASLSSVGITRKDKTRLFQILGHFEYKKMKRMEPKEKKAFEPTGLVPRSIVRTFERFRQQLLPGSERAAIREYRISRYQVLVSARCLFALLTIPIATNWFVSSWLLSPIIEHYWNTQQSEIFLNSYQEERAFAELEFFSDKLFFESLLSNQNDARSASKGRQTPSPFKIEIAKHRSFSQDNQHIFFINNASLRRPFGVLPYTQPCWENKLGKAVSRDRIRLQQDTSCSRILDLSYVSLHNSECIFDFAPALVQARILSPILSASPVHLAERQLYYSAPSFSRNSTDQFMDIWNTNNTENSVKIKEKIQEKIVELAVYYNEQTILSITNIAGDFISVLTLGCLFIWMKPEISILKSFLIEAIYSLSDTTKSFLLILLTDLLVGFHSPRGWETALELLLKHFGLPENQDFVFLFVATFPVLLDTVFKYWIFRHLNKISPSTVATYHSMIE